MINLIKYLQNMNTYMYLLILGISLVYVQIKKNIVFINMIFNLLISGLYYYITKQMIIVIIFTIIVSLGKIFWILNNKEFTEIEKPLNILDNIDVTKTKEILNTLKFRKKYYSDKKLSINLFLIGTMTISIQLSSIIGTFSLADRTIFLKILIFGIVTILMSIYFGLKAEKLLNKIDSKIKECINVQSNSI